MAAWFGRTHSLDNDTRQLAAGRGLASWLRWLTLFVMCAAGLSSATDVVTYHNDIYRSGQNLQETILTPSNVNSTAFGKLATLPGGQRH